MSQAINEHSIPIHQSASGFSVAAITAGLSAPPLVGATAPGADAELIRLCFEAAQCEARLRHIDQHGTSDEDCRDALDAWDEAYTQVTNLPATTPGGIRAKASALRLAIIRENAIEVGTNEPIDDIPIYDPDGRLDTTLAMSLCQDILAGRAVA